MELSWTFGLRAVKMLLFFAFLFVSTSSSHSWFSLFTTYSCPECIQYSRKKHIFWTIGLRQLCREIENLIKFKTQSTNTNKWRRFMCAWTVSSTISVLLVLLMLSMPSPMHTFNSSTYSHQKEHVLQFIRQLRNKWYKSVPFYSSKTRNISECVYIHSHCVLRCCEYECRCQFIYCRKLNIYWGIVIVFVDGIRSLSL